MSGSSVFSVLALPVSFTSSSAHMLGHSSNRQGSRFCVGAIGNLGTAIVPQPERGLNVVWPVSGQCARVPVSGQCFVWGGGGNH